MATFPALQFYVGFIPDALLVYRPNLTMLAFSLFFKDLSGVHKWAREWALPGLLERTLSVLCFTGLPVLYSPQPAAGIREIRDATPQERIRV